MTYSIFIYVLAITVDRFRNETSRGKWMQEKWLTRGKRWREQRLICELEESCYGSWWADVPCCHQYSAALAHGNMEGSLQAAEHIFLLMIKTGSFSGQYSRQVCIRERGRGEKRESSRYRILWLPFYNVLFTSPLFDMSAASCPNQFLSAFSYALAMASCLLSLIAQMYFILVVFKVQQRNIVLLSWVVWGQFNKGIYKVLESLEGKHKGAGRNVLLPPWDLQGKGERMITETWKEGWWPGPGKRGLCGGDHLEKYYNPWLKITASPSAPCREKAGEHIPSTSLSFLPFSYCCFALTETRLKPESKRNHWVSMNPPAMRETWVWSLGWEDPLERAWQPTPVFLPGESPWAGETSGLQPMGSQRVGYDSAPKHRTAHMCSSVSLGHRRMESDVEGWTDSIHTITVIDLDLPCFNLLSCILEFFIILLSNTLVSCPSIFLLGPLGFISHLSSAVGQASLAAISVITSTSFLTCCHLPCYYLGISSSLSLLGIQISTSSPSSTPAYRGELPLSPSVMLVVSSLAHSFPL